MRCYENQVIQLKQTIRDLNLGSLTEFKVVNVNLRKDISDLKTENFHLKFVFSQLHN